RFIVRPQVGSDSNRWWRKNPVAGHFGCNGRAAPVEDVLIGRKAQIVAKKHNYRGKPQALWFATINVLTALMKSAA
ncbi:hypothetical protein, partial [Paracoccus marcusii]|uniref:hypothetical protein n=1 Tax=Paracoccus marcusii TaxID=59779 RepID=UPI001AD81002